MQLSLQCRDLIEKARSNSKSNEEPAWRISTVLLTGGWGHFGNPAGKVAAFLNTLHSTQSNHVFDTFPSPPLPQTACHVKRGGLYFHILGVPLLQNKSWTPVICVHGSAAVVLQLPKGHRNTRMQHKANRPDRSPAHQTLGYASVLKKRKGNTCIDLLYFSHSTFPRNSFFSQSEEDSHVSQPGLLATSNISGS